MHVISYKRWASKGKTEIETIFLKLYYDTAEYKITLKRYGTYGLNLEILTQTSTIGGAALTRHWDMF